jgi:arabinan endo-1,5-alpha-L-arabinosidase
MSSDTYRNPVYPATFADPFVLRHGEWFYAYGTNERVESEWAFEVLRSKDLVSWTSLGRCLRARDGSARDYWAPEVAEHDGRLYMYYSVGVEDRDHHLRVAVADDPSGPFEDLGVDLTPAERFAIDAHPFRDEDGTWYLFYAHDVLDGDRPGTSLAVDRLLDMTRLVGEPVTILRATEDWQRFQAERPMYGSVYDWHTLEGPFVVRRQGRLWCTFSGGAWTSAGYGVSYAVADHPFGPWTQPQQGPALLRSLEGWADGPGHNSIIAGPNGEDLLVYHAWDRDRTARRMCIDRLTWSPEGPRTDGPTVLPQPAPGRLLAPADAHPTDATAFPSPAPASG